MGTSNLDLFYLFIMGAVMLPVASSLMFLGPRYIPAPEVSLMMLLETILGPLWVWLVIRENPGIYSIVGGTIVLLTLAVNTWLGLREDSTRKNVSRTLHSFSRKKADTKA
jgi:drug/metabolite transporter (DMT)-like permease